MSKGPTELTIGALSAQTGVSRRRSPHASRSSGRCGRADGCGSVTLGLLDQPGLQWRHRLDRVLRRVLDPGHDPPVARRSVWLPAPLERGACAHGQCATRHAPPRPAPARSPSHGVRASVPYRLCFRRTEASESLCANAVAVVATDSWTIYVRAWTAIWSAPPAPDRFRLLF
jgi:hypothetical protein